MDAILPAGTLAVFPVQFFSQRELRQAATLRTSRTGADQTETIYFRDSFGGGRPTLTATTPHRAIDVMAPRGLPIFATVAATVPATWTVYEEVTPNHRVPVQIPGVGTPHNPRNNDGGNYAVMMDHTGRHHYYAHMDERPLVSIGQNVEVGQLLGYVGNTGRRAQHSGTHLHYQVTTRPVAGHGPLIFWNPFAELERLATAIGGRRHGGQIALAFDDFLHAVQTRLGTALVDPFSGAVSPEMFCPWDMAF